MHEIPVGHLPELEVLGESLFTCAKYGASAYDGMYVPSSAVYTYDESVLFTNVERSMPIYGQTDCAVKPLLADLAGQPAHVPRQP